MADDSARADAVDVHTEPDRGEPADHVGSARRGEPGSSPHLLAVDGNSLGHRAYHSSRGDQVDDPRPLTTGAMVSMLATAWSYGPYDALIIGFDDAVNQRKLEEPVYKSGRPPTPPELTAALATAAVHLEACGFPVVIHPGAEADDVLAAATDACERRGWRCDLLSSDRDLTALVSDTTRLLRPRARFADLEVEDPAQVRRRYGIEPWQYTDLAALRGDPSDGLVGASGIGPKTAARLLRDHGSVLGLYRVLHELPPKVEASLREARDRVERNLHLMSPIPHLAIDLDAALAAGVDPELVSAILEPLGLEGAARRFTRAIDTRVPALPPMPPPPDEDAEPDGDRVNGRGDGGSDPDAPSLTASRCREVAGHGEQTALF